jgi:hypothetical protein
LYLHPTEDNVEEPIEDELDRIKVLYLQINSLVGFFMLEMEPKASHISYSYSPKAIILIQKITKHKHPVRKE